MQSELQIKVKTRFNKRMTEGKWQTQDKGIGFLKVRQLLAPLLDLGEGSDQRMVHCWWLKY